MASLAQELHLVVQVSDGRQMLATCAGDTVVSALTAQLEAELAQTFHTADRVSYLGKVVQQPHGPPSAAAGSTGEGPGEGGGAKAAAAQPPNFALSAAARAGQLLRDGDTVLAVLAESSPEAPRASGEDMPEPSLSSVAECAARWEELERLSLRGRRHVAACLGVVGAREPREVVGEVGRRLLGGLAASAGLPELQRAACAALAAATAIPQLAGLEAGQVLRQAEEVSHGRAEGGGGAPSIAALLLGLCRTNPTATTATAAWPAGHAGGGFWASPEVRAEAEAVLRHLQAEARAERARRATHRGDFGYGPQSMQYAVGSRGTADGAPPAEKPPQPQPSEPSKLGDGSILGGGSGRPAEELLGDVLRGEGAERVTALWALSRLALQVRVKIMGLLTLISG
jgi:hypothetical protein